MSTCPPLFVAAPPADPYVGGLFSAAYTPEVPADPHWQCGVQWETDNCHRPGVWAETCPPGVPEDKPQDYAPAWQTATPFNLVMGVDCSLPGNTLDDFRRRLLANAQAGAQAVIERVYWTGEQGNTPRLAGPAAVDPDAPADGEVVVLATEPLTFVGGVSLLETYLAQNYNANGVIHAPSGLAPYAAKHNQICGACSSNGQLRTVLGTRWAFGRGYEINTGPGGVPAEDGVAWMYATGRVAVWAGPITIPNEGQLEAAFAIRSNTVNLFAEQTVIVGHECVLAAVPVVIGCDC